MNILTLDLGSRDGKLVRTDPTVDSTTAVTVPASGSKLLGVVVPNQPQVHRVPAAPDGFTMSSAIGVGVVYCEKGENRLPTAIAFATVGINDFLLRVILPFFIEFF